MKIGILFNCQHEGLTTALRALRPNDDIIDFSYQTSSDDPAAQARVAATLAGCDHVVTLDLAPGYGPLSTDTLRRHVPRLHLLPYFRFAGFHPDTIAVNVGNVPLDGPTGGYHSRIAVAGFLAGLSPRATADLYNRLAFSRLGYLNRFAEQHALLLERYATYRIDLRAAFDRWVAPGCFMHSINHPRMRVMLDLALAICAMTGLKPPASLPTEADLPDPLRGHPTHPVFSDIAAALDIAPAGAFRGAAVGGAMPRVLSTEAFVTGCHAAFQRAPLGALRQVDGMTAAMAALGLAEMPRLRPLPPTPTALSTVFLTHHGRVLAIEAASAMLVQQPLLSDDSDYTDLVVAIPSLPITAAATSPMMGGVTLAPAWRPGTVSLRRGSKYLFAAFGQTVLFNRDAVTAFGCLLPVRHADVENLRSLTRGDWITHTGAHLPAATNRILSDFTLALGGLRVDLCRHMPRPLTGEDGAVRFEIMAGGDTFILKPDPSPRVRQEILLHDAPRHLRPAYIGSPEEFRLTQDARLKLQGDTETLHPPLDVSDADRDWLHVHYFDKTAASGIGRRAYDTTIVRQRNTILLLDEGIEGAILSGGTAVKDFGAIIRSPKLPAYIRTVGQDRLLEQRIIDSAPALDGPVCVFYNSNLHDYFHWLTGSMLALHVLAPQLPPGTRLVLPRSTSKNHRAPQSTFDHASFLPALGFAKFATLQMDIPAIRLADAIWLENESVLATPAAQLQSFRTRAAAMRPAPAGPGKRLYIKRTQHRRIAEPELLEAFLTQQGFETVALENMAITAQMDSFANAEIVVAAHGAGLANLLFCPAGTRVLELTPECEYRPFFWAIAQKLGLLYSVLPCPTTDGSFNGDLMVDLPRFRALLRILRSMLG